MTLADYTYGPQRIFGEDPVLFPVAQEDLRYVWFGGLRDVDMDADELLTWTVDEVLLVPHVVY